MELNKCLQIGCQQSDIRAAQQTNVTNAEHPIGQWCARNKVAGRKWEQAYLYFIAPINHQLRIISDLDIICLIPEIPPNRSVNLCGYAHSG